MPRLIYADWLEEFGTCDLDRATVEFIRVSCHKDKPGVQMPRAAYAWIESNWRRLIPTAIARYPWQSAAWCSFWRDGRTIRTHWRHTDFEGTPETGRKFTVHFEFNRGFITHAINWSNDASRKLVPLIRVDQPFVPMPMIVTREAFSGTFAEAVREG